MYENPRYEKKPRVWKETHGMKRNPGYEKKPRVWKETQGIHFWRLGMIWTVFYVFSYKFPPNLTVFNTLLGTPLYESTCFIVKKLNFMYLWKKDQGMGMKMCPKVPSHPTWPKRYPNGPIWTLLWSLYNHGSKLNFFVKM